MTVFHNLHVGFIKKVICVVAISAVALAGIIMPHTVFAASPKFEQFKDKKITSGNVNSVAFSNPNKAGSLIVVYVLWENTGGVTVTDSRNTYTPVAPATKFAGNQWSSQVFYAKNVGVGSNTVTATFASSISEWAMIYIHEYSGIDKVNPLDTSSVAIGSSSAMNSGLATLTGTNDLIFAAGGSSNRVTAAGSGYTTRSTLSDDRTMDRIVTAAGSYNATATQNGNAWVLHMVAFKADSGTPDTTAPTTTITSPTNSQTVTGTINVTATASDNVGVSNVELLVDGVVKTSDNTSPYILSLNTTTLTDGSHTLTTRASDAAGNTGLSPAVIVTVNNTPVPDTTPPTVSMTAPSEGATVNGTITMAANATDNVAVTQVEFYADGQLKGTDATNPYSYSLDTTALSDGSHVLTVKAFDAAGNNTVSAPVNVTVVNTDTQPPTAPTNLTATSVSSTQVHLSWNSATDNVGVTGYHIFRDGTDIGTTPNTTFESTGLTPETTYTYTVRANDATGNISADSNAATATTMPNNGMWPLQTSANGRYLVDQNGSPFLIIGDSPQGIVASLLPTGPNSITDYLNNRQATGFNTLWINLLSRGQTGGPFSGATPDGLAPFTGFLAGSQGNPEYYDLSKPNTAYFDRAEYIIDQAAARNMLVILDPIETMDHLGILQHNAAVSPNTPYNYGVWLANRFAGKQNVIWKHGNDFNTWPNNADRALVRAVAQAIKDTTPSKYQTLLADAGRPSAALDLVYGVTGFGPADPAWAPLLQLDTVYAYNNADDLTSREYARATIPVYLAETWYDFEESAIDTRYNRKILEFRCQQYGALLSGAMGHTYGNYRTVYLDNGWNTANSLNTPAVANLMRVKSLFTSLQWQNLVPERSVVLSGTQSTSCGSPYGQQGGGFDMAPTAARTPDGNLVVVYMPSARAVTINMSRLNGPATAQWFDPTTGVYTAATCTAQGANCQFTPPSTVHQETSPLYQRDGQNQENSTDWVLVLRAGTPDSTPPTAPTGLAAIAVSATQINLTWNNDATDNVGVTGFRVYRNGVQVGTTTSTSYQDNGLAAETTYSYEVSAQDAAGNVSPRTPVATATTLSPDVTPPTTPTNLVAGTVSQTQASLSWTASTDTAPGSVAGYQVFRCQGAGCTNYAQVSQGLVPGTSFADTALTANTTYMFAVKAVDNSGNTSAFSTPLSITTQSAPPISQWLMAAWNFNEAAGTSSADITGHNNTATINGPSPWTAGKNGGGVTLNGSSNYLSVPNSSSTNIAGTELTVSLWLNPQQLASGDAVVLGKFWNTSAWTDPYYQYGFELWGGNQPVFQIGTSTGLKTALMGSTIPYNQWTHVAVVYNGTQATFYVNGVAVSSPGLTGSIVARGNAMNMGADQSIHQFFKGGLDDVRLYNKALTQADVQADMNNPL